MYNLFLLSTVCIILCISFCFTLDASVIPTIPNGNVHSSVLVVSSILSDMIIEEIHVANAQS